MLRYLIISMAMLSVAAMVGSVYGGDCHPPKDEATAVANCTYTESTNDPEHPNQTVTINCRNRIPFYEVSNKKSKTTDSQQGGACGYKDFAMTKECPKHTHTSIQCNE
jgi:hypothetical protein